MRPAAAMIVTPAAAASMLLVFAAASWSTPTTLAWTTTPISRSRTTTTTRPRHAPYSLTQLGFFSKETTADEVQLKPDKRQDVVNDNNANNNDWLATLQSSLVPTTTTSTTSTTSKDGESSSSNGLLQMLQQTAVAAAEPAVQTAQSVLDETTGGWALSFSNLHPESAATATGQAFLATNLFYLTAGLWLQFVTGDVVLGVATDLCAAASFVYHYQQLEAVNAQTGQITVAGRQAVRLALLMDYIFAVTAIGLASWDLVQLPFLLQTAWSDIITAVAVASAGIACLTLSWKYEDDGPAYIWWHGLWHAGSAYTGFLVGNLHQQAILATAAAATAAASM